MNIPEMDFVIFRPSAPSEKEVTNKELYTPLVQPWPATSPDIETTIEEPKATVKETNATTKDETVAEIVADARILLCDQIDQVAPAHRVDDIDEVLHVDSVHQVLRP